MRNFVRALFCILLLAGCTRASTPENTTVNSPKESSVTSESSSSTKESTTSGTNPDNPKESVGGTTSLKTEQLENFVNELKKNRASADFDENIVPEDL
jgi:hypothetical protein